MTHVRVVTADTVLGAFTLFSVFLAAARVGAQNPDDRATGIPSAAPHKIDVAKARPDELANAKQFRLILTYHGVADKPYYNLILSVPPLAVQHNPFSLFVPISEDQGAKIIKHLKTFEFFKHAQVTDNQNDPETGPQYLLRVRHGVKHFQESLGWDTGTIIRLDGIRKTLDGDSAKLMDQLLARLDGQRKVWKSGEVVGGLKSTLSAEKKNFAAGQPIPIKLELTNVGAQDRQYWQHPFIISGSEIIVTDEHGRRAPFRGVDAGTQALQVTIKPAETKVIEACDLSSYYYLRRPGRYTVAFRAGGLPPSNSLGFEVSPAATADGDPMGRLLSLDSAKWSLKGSPNASAKIRPGRDREVVPGWQFVLIDPGTGTKGSKTFVSLWLTDKTAEIQMEARPENESVRASEYLGKVSRWHVYFQAPAQALTAWPTAKEDIMKALAAEPKHGAAEPAALKTPQWGEAKDGLRTRLVAGKHVIQAGEPIPMKLEVENTSDLTRDYFIPPVTNNESLIHVVDERGKQVPYLGRLFQFWERPERLGPGQTRELQAFDLASSYYLRRPGRYTVRFPGNPASAAIEFEIVPNPTLAAADGDPVGRLLPLVKDKWWLGAGTSQPRLKPGSNWGEVPGRIVWFVFNPPQFKNDSGMIWMCLTDEAAPALPPHPESSMPSLEYWGKISRWHVYVLMSEIAINAWPTAKEDIMKALAAEPKMSFNVTVTGEVKPTEVAEGAPIPLVVTIRNELPGEIEFHGFGVKATDWNAETARLTLVDIYRDGEPGGLFVSKPMVSPPPKIAGMSREVIPAGKELRLETDARKWTIKGGWVPGRYRVNVRVSNLRVDQYSTLSTLSDWFEFVIKK